MTFSIANPDVDYVWGVFDPSSGLKHEVFVYIVLAQLYSFLMLKVLLLDLCGSWAQLVMYAELRWAFLVGFRWPACITHRFWELRVLFFLSQIVTDLLPSIYRLNDGNEYLFQAKDDVSF